MKTKIIAFDVYGTILATDDPDNALKVQEMDLRNLPQNAEDEGLTLSYFF
jgi:FMN phosphatase YigB (HAD superfamily)